MLNRLFLLVVFVGSEGFHSQCLLNGNNCARQSRRTQVKMSSAPLNKAFVFVKPHAVTEKTIELVKTEMDKAGLTITEEGSISSETIDSKMLVDQHYYAIASKATITPPAELAVPEEKFKEFFGCEWKDVLAEGKAMTATEASKALGLDGAEMDKAWGQAKDAGLIIKLGGGFYCGKLGQGDDELYTFNAFYASMRERFTKPGGSIYYFVVEWDAEVLPWSKFRGELLGPTDPASAPPNSIRGQIFSKWKDLGLSAEPNTGDNGVHASASPFEALAERMNWLEIKPADDPFGAYILENGLDQDTLLAWTKDPVITYDNDGAKGSLFDALEDTDTSLCADKIAEFVQLA
mmetsp:Transcript_14707/g.19551  ORF Transcript_14707/g.19551 Transcript_14707/m.19551 type:complete len:348 (+) Transcript_14707:78-1121(+)